MSWFRRFWYYVKTWREHHTIIKELNALSDRQLKDIGVNRADIDRLVWLQEDKEKRGKDEK